jgi:hypothetical protein
MQDTAASAIECRTAATLLAKLCTAEDQSEAILRLRSGGRTCAQILLSLTLNPDANGNVRESAASALAQLTAAKEGAQVDLLAFVRLGDYLQALFA